MAILSNVAYLMRQEYGTTGFQKLVDVTSAPDMGGAPDQIDITTLSDRKFRNMNGIQSAATLEFSAWYDKDVYTILKAIEEVDYDKTDAELDTYQLWYGANGVHGKFQWQGKLSVYVGAIGINEAVPMTITISEEGPNGIEFVTGSGPAPVTTHSVTYNLTDASSDNNARTVVDGGSYNATITADGSYTLGTVTVTMGGTDISATAVAGGTITISNVTGDIVITATAS